MLQQLEEQRREKLTQIDRQATESGFMSLKGPGGLMLAPAVGEKLLSDENLERLTVEERGKSVASARPAPARKNGRAPFAKWRKPFAMLCARSIPETAVYTTRHVIEDLRPVVTICRRFWIISPPHRPTLPHTPMSSAKGKSRKRGLLWRR